MFNALFDGLAWLLDFFYTYAGRSYGLAIALLTLTVMLLCFPLTAKGTRGMAAMSKLQPELKRIQQKYKDDRQKQSEETMALFKEHKVSPAGGCLPLLVQAPVFFIMYRVLIGLTHRGRDGTFDPKYLSPESTLYRALDQAREMKSLGINLAETASEAVRASLAGSVPFFLIIGAVVATGYYQQAQITRRNPQAAGAADNPYMQSMQRMQKIFPLMYLVFGFTLPAGILIYFLVSNLFRIGQQALIYKMDPSLLPSTAASVVDAKSKDVARSKDVATAKADAKKQGPTGRPSKADSGGQKGSNQKADPKGKAGSPGSQPNGGPVKPTSRTGGSDGPTSGKGATSANGSAGPAQRRPGAGRKQSKKSRRGR